MLGRAFIDVIGGHEHRLTLRLVRWVLTRIGARWRLAGREVTSRALLAGAGDGLRLREQEDLT